VFTVCTYLYEEFSLIQLPLSVLLVSTRQNVGLKQPLLFVALFRVVENARTKQVYKSHFAASAMFTGLSSHLDLKIVYTTAC